MTRAGSRESARATSRNSITSSRRSPCSNFDTNDCGRPSRAARVAWVIPARALASTNNRRNCACLRLNADLGTPRVCNPYIGYPKLGYAWQMAHRRDARIECPLCRGRGTTNGSTARPGTAICDVCVLCRGNGSIAARQLQRIVAHAPASLFSECARKDDR